MLWSTGARREVREDIEGHLGGKGARVARPDFLRRGGCTKGDHSGGCSEVKKQTGTAKTGRREHKSPARPRKGLLMPVLYCTHIIDPSFPFPCLIWWGQDARGRQSGSQVSTTELRRSIMTALHPRLALNRLSPTLQTFSFSPGWRTTTLFHSPESKAMPPTMKRTLSLLSPSPLHGVHPRRALCLNGKHPNLMTGRDAFAPGIRVRQA